NRMELEALTGFPCGSEEEIVFACDVLRGKGVRRVFVSLGAEGMLYRGPEGTLRGRSRPVAMVNATASIRRCSRRRPHRRVRSDGECPH
ncbi:MAG: hypothetical protein IJG13_18400, partial [Kiritimatiellae bacterium]|nr:hypothetical protein [Kiritimatiellia bacterium]